MTSLNPNQQKIVEHFEGPALVIAGAGSGKTRVITHRVARLIERGVPPSAIMMVTFTNKAAEEMMRRAEGFLERGEQIKHIFSGTFHSLANRFLRRHADLVGFKSNFSILDQVDSRDLIKASMAEAAPERDRRFPTAAVVQSIFSMAFNRNLKLGEYLEQEMFWLCKEEERLAAILAVYRKKKRANNGMDFDDLLANWHKLLNDHPGLEMARRLRFLMVDEYQDTNLVQAEILEKLCGDHRNLMVVGDDAQSIYGWRGANFANILDFPERIGGTVFRLEENYRSTPDILDLANSSINHNTAQFEKRLYSVRSQLDRPRVHFLFDQYEEADLICDKILAYADQDIPLREMGVLYRNHNQSATLQMRLTERDIPFMIRSGIKFFEQAHLKDVVAFLKVVFNPLDEIGWFRILKMLPGVGNTTAHRIIGIFQEQQAVRITADNPALVKALPKKAAEGWQRLAKTFKTLLTEGIGPSEMIDQVLRGFYREVLYAIFDDAAEREEDLKYLADFAGKYRSLERFLAQLALVGSTVIRDHDEEEAGEDDYLTLTTIHQAKGLEWDVVFLMGLADGKLPHARNLEPQEKLEEERRLFYVAITRCRKHLELTVPSVSIQNGQSEICRPSRFVEELPDKLIEIIKATDVDYSTVSPRRRPGILVDW